MSDDFARELLKQSVARTCVALGYNKAPVECLECMADVLANFITTIGQKSHDIAEYAGRYQPGFHDVVASCGSMGKGFNWKELKDFAFNDTNQKKPSTYSLYTSSQNAPELRWNQPFLHDVPLFPLAAKSRNSRFVESSKASTGKGTSEQVKEGADPNEKLRGRNKIDEIKERKKLGIPEHCIPLPLPHLYKTTRETATTKRKQAASGSADGSANNEAQLRKKRILSAQAARDSTTKIENAFDATIFKS